MEDVIPRALPRTCYVPRLWLWPGQAVYVGPSLGLDPHSGSVSCLAVAINGTFEVRVDATSGFPARSALIPSRLRHQIVPDAELMAFCYLDPGSARHRACHQAMTTTADALGYRHRHETALALLAEDLSHAEQAHAWLDLASGDSPPSSGADVTMGQQAGPAGEDGCRRLDPRIRRAVAALHGLDPSEDAPAARLAALVGLSPSRFLHLFKDHTGTSYRRYRLWLRMLCAADLLRHGHDLTTAAAGAGFASPSHFSDTFHAMFGLRPRQLLGTTEINLARPPHP